MGLWWLLGWTCCGRRADEALSAGRSCRATVPIARSDALEADGQHRPDTQQSLALRSPVARRSGTVSFAGHEHECVIIGAIALGNLPDPRDRAARRVQRMRQRQPRSQRIRQPKRRASSSDGMTVVSYEADAPLLRRVVEDSPDAPWRYAKRACHVAVARELAVKCRPHDVAHSLQR
jgi:hypothetical protein